MEEKPKPRAQEFLVPFLLFGLGAGFVGGIYGGAMSTSRGIFSLTENAFTAACIGGLLSGAAVGIGMWKLQPGRDFWIGCLGRLLLLGADVVIASLVSLAVCFVLARAMR